MSSLPSAWKMVSLGKIGNYHNGRAFKSQEWGDKGRPIIRIQNLTDHKKEFNYFNGEVKPENEINDGDFLMSWSGTLGAYIWNRGPAVLNQHIFKVESFINQRFHYYLVSSYISYLYTRTRGTGLAHVTKTEFEKTKVPLPPIEEQERIADKLDLIFEKLQVCNIKLNSIPNYLHELEKSIIVHAFNGNLTNTFTRNSEDIKNYYDSLVQIKLKLREEKLIKEEKEAENTSGVKFTCPNHWIITKLSSLCVSISDGDHQAPPKAKAGIPFLVIGNVSDGILDLARASRFVPQKYFDSLTGIRKPKVNDILYSVTGSYGIPILVNTEEKFCFQRHVGILRALEGVNPKYLYYLLKHPYIYAQATACATGTAQLTVPLGGLRAFDVPIMTPEEQRLIVEKIETVLNKLNIIRSQYNNLLSRFNVLSSSILKTAFEGRLVENSAESVDELLQQIEALKITTKKPTTKKKTKKVVKK